MSLCSPSAERMAEAAARPSNLRSIRWPPARSRSAVTHAPSICRVTMWPESGSAASRSLTPHGRSHRSANAEDGATEEGGEGADLPVLPTSPVVAVGADAAIA